MKAYHIIVPALMLLPSCKDPGADYPEPVGTMTTVEAAYSVSKVRTVTGTRTPAGEEVGSVTLAVSGVDVLFSTVRRLSGGQVTFSCPPGTYAIRATANVTVDPATPMAGIDTLSVSVPLHPDMLPMSYSAVETIPASRSVHPIGGILLERAVAKVTYSVTVAPEAGDIRLSGISCRSLPSRTRLFGDGAQNPYPRFDSAVEAPDDASHHSGSFIMAENLAGTVPSVTTERERDETSAPEGASYILLTAGHGDKVLRYRIYLGENTTSDFNVRRNTEYILSIVIRGDDTVDTRITGYTLSVADCLSSGRIGPYSVADDRGTVRFSISGSGRTMFTGDISLECGDVGSFTVDGVTGRERTDISHLLGEGEVRVEATYLPPAFTSANSAFACTVGVADQYGYSRTERFAHTFANAVNAYSARSGEGLPGGTCTFAGALAVEDDGAGLTRAAVLGDEYSVTATARFGYEFEGWYADAGLSRRLSTMATLSRRAASTVENLYARFDYSSDRITYTSTTATTVSPDPDAFGRANIESNTYADGRGVITFDGDVTEIGYGAFSSASTLERISLPQTVESIGAEAFRMCRALRSIRIPERTVAVARECFSGCVALEQATIAAESSTVGDRAFYNCSSLGRIGLAGTTSVGQEAFCHCRDLASADLGSALSIGPWAFAYCTGLREVTLSKWLGVIPKYAFQSCSSLSEVTIPASVQSIGEGAFHSCTALETVICLGLTPPAPSTGMFDSCTALSRILVPEEAVDAYRQSWAGYRTLIQPY